MLFAGTSATLWLATSTLQPPIGTSHSPELTVRATSAAKSSPPLALSAPRLVIVRLRALLSLATTQPKLLVSSVLDSLPQPSRKRPLNAAPPR